MPTHVELEQRSKQRFWSKVVKTDGCWLWQGATSVSGYGRVRVNKVMRPAHRVAYEWEFGPVPAGLQLDHLCRTVACVRPSHLEPVSARENTLRGEAPSARAARTNVCGRGHSLADAYVSTRSNGEVGRHCRTCQKLRRTRASER